MCSDLFFEFLHQYSFTIYGVPELRYFSYDYATFFLQVHIFTQILHNSPLNYCHISFQYTFAIQDALDFFSRGPRIVSNIPQKTAHDPCRRPSER